MLGVGAASLIAAGISGVGQLIQNRYNAAREDTAFQRRVADMRSAGLSPVLYGGQGLPASSSPSPVAEGAEKALLYMQAQKMKKDIALADAQIANVNADTSAKQVGNLYAVNTLADREAQARASSAMAVAEAEAKTSLRQWTDNNGNVVQGSEYEMRRAIAQFDSLIKQGNAAQAKALGELYSRLVAELEVNGVQNPLVSEAVAKQAASQVAVKQSKWFDTGKWIQAGTQVLGAGVGAFGGITGGMLNIGKWVTPSEY